MYQLSPDLKTLINICRAAAEVQRHYFASSHLKIQQKPGQDAYRTPFTQADLATEDLIEKSVRANFDPNIQFIGEETWQERYPDIDAFNPQKPFWMVDALDGTLEFINKRDGFTINIALIENGIPVMGVVHSPMRGNFYVADKTGAYQFNDKDGRIEKIQSKYSTFFRGIITKRPQQDLCPIDISLCKAGFIEVAGSDVSAFRMCKVANGLYNFSPFPFHGSEWDCAASHAFLRAAGADLVDINGRSLTYGNIKEGFKTPHLFAMGNTSAVLKNLTLARVREWAHTHKLTP